MLAYLAALHDEVSLVLRRGRFRKARAPAGMLAYFEPAGSRGTDVMVVATGWGAAAARAGARWVLAELRPSAIVSVGFSGGTRAGLGPGALVVGERVVALGDHPTEDAPLEPASHVGLMRTDAAKLSSDRTLLGLAHSSAQALRMEVAAGLVGTTPFVVTSAARKAAVGVTTGVVAIDLESWHVARVAIEGAIPFLAIRAVVDTVDDELPGFVTRMAPGPRPPATLPALRYLIGRPGSLGEIIHTGRAAGRARRTLAQFVSAFSARWQASPLAAPRAPGLAPPASGASGPGR